MVQFDQDEIADAASYLIRLREACTAEERVALAEAGLLASGMTDDLKLLLLRNLYRGHIDLGQLQDALAVASQMTAVAVEGGHLREVAHHDAARVLAALGRLPEAVEEQRLATHTALPSRRSFHFWCLATLQHFAGSPDEALASLARGLEFAGRDRLLLEAHFAFIQLERGVMPERLDDLLGRLRNDPSAGYGRYLRGMIAFHMGNHAVARVFLTSWLRRNEGTDPAKQITLSEELRRAREALSAIPTAGDDVTLGTN